MSCCGLRRLMEKSAPGLNASKISFDSALQQARRSQPPADVVFEYFGETSLIVTGPITGRRYRFDNTGAKLSVDRRDAPGITAIPQLRRS